MPVNSIEWLQQWYTVQCDDKWEHRHGITIQTLDNPGWLVKVDLIGTSLQGARMREVGELSKINHKGSYAGDRWQDRGPPEHVDVMLRLSRRRVR